MIDDSHTSSQEQDLIKSCLQGLLTKCWQKKYAFDRSYGIMLLVALLLPTVGLADVILPPLVADHMVLQRDQAIKLWGQADPDEKVSLQFAGQRAVTRADSTGHWQVALTPVAAGGPYELTVQGKNKLVLRDVLVGDVWLCSGQSNMDWMVKDAADPEQTIAAATYPTIRLFQVPRHMSTTLMDQLDSGIWQLCSPATINTFSAVAYFFGRHLHQHLDVPIGLIQSSWGGTKIETWMSASAIGSLEAYQQEIATLSSFELEKLSKAAEKQYEAWKANLAQYDQGMQDGQALWAQPDVDTATWQNVTVPSYWEHVGFEGLDGVVWLRKEFVLTQEVAEKPITLHLGPIYHADITYVNGQKVGEILEEDRRWEPRSYPVPAQYVKAGSNTLTVRVENYGGKGGLYGKPEEVYLSAAGYRQPLHGQWKLKSSTRNLPARPKKIGPNSKPTLLYNAMIHPLSSYPIKGVIWYQGESNVSQAEAYRTLFPLMIQDWRQQWGYDFPFLFVQLPGFGPPAVQPAESKWAALREAQLRTLSVPHTGMAITIDIGDTYSIHPLNKQDVGQRLALAARKVAYGEDIVYSGPVYDTMKVEGNTIRIYFKHTGAGLRAESTTLPEFAIAGEDRQFVPAQAIIKEHTVLVWSNEVPHPVAVRYGWADNPVQANLYNDQVLPAAPFRTDQW